MKAITLSVLAAFVLAMGMNSCKPDEPEAKPLQTPNLPSTPFNYVNVDLPDHLEFMADNTPSDNITTDHGATLGRVLFYDPLLSINNRISCASCHKQDKAFADDAAESMGFGGKFTSRNSPPVQNARFMGAYFWDNRANNLEEMVMMPIENHIEMGLENFDNLAEKLSMVDYYDELFTNAFGTNEITPEKISMGLSQFLRSMTTYQSKYDEGVATGFANFDPVEMEGFQLFQTLHCNGCHGGENFDGWAGAVANIGLDEVYEDQGMGDLPEWVGQGVDGMFKVPSLRNVELTAPYMHDGRYATLEEVIDHYDHGVKPHYNLHYTMMEDPFNGDQTPKKLNLTDTQKVALIRFLETLTDPAYTQDPKFSNPFR